MTKVIKLQSKCEIFNAGSRIFNNFIVLDLTPSNYSNKQGTLQHVFELAGVYSVSVTAYNDISSSVKQLPSYIYVQNPVTGVEILDHSSNNQVVNRMEIK